MKSAKICASVCSISFTGMVIGIRSTGRFFPWIHSFVFVCSITLMIGIIYGSLSLLSTLITVLPAAVSLRVLIYISPSSMIGIDPDGYALEVNNLIFTEGTKVIRETSGVYSRFSVFHLVNGVTSLVTGLDGMENLIAMPLLTGVLFTLTGPVLVKRTIVHHSSRISTGTAAIIGGFAAVGVLFSYWPIPQMTAVLLWCPALVFISRYFKTINYKSFIAIAIIITTSVFTHKLSIFLPLLICGTTLLLYFISAQKLISNTVREYSNSKLFKTNSEDSNISIIIYLLFIFGLALAIQWIFVGEYLPEVILVHTLPFFTGGVSVVPTANPVTAAVPGNPGIFGILTRRGHYLVFLPIVSIAGLWLWTRDRTLTTSFLICAAAIPIILSGLSIVGVGVAPPRRFIVYGIPAFAAILGIVTSYYKVNKAEKMTVSTFFLVFLLIFAQSGSAVLAPDYPSEPRMYLTEGEVSAKIFMMEHSESKVAMDPYYADERVQFPNQVVTNESDVRFLSEQLLNGTLITDGHGTTLLREHVDVIRFGKGRYRLTWSPIQGLSNSPRFNRVFDNGHTVGFRS